MIKTVRIGDILEEFSNRRPLGAEPEVLTLTERNGFVRQADRFNKRLAVEDTRNYKHIGRGDIAFNPYLLWAGAIAQNRDWDSAIISPLYPTFRVRDGFDANFTIRLLLSDRLIKRYDSIAYGSVPRKRRTAVADFLALEIPCPPPLKEQQRIAHVLDQVDALRSKRRETIVLLDNLAQSIFLDMFGDPSRNTKGWRIRTIGDLIDSAKYGTSEKAVESGELPVLRMNNITSSGKMDLRDLKYMRDSHVGERYLVRAGDILFNRTNSPDLVGKTAIYRGTKPLAYAGYLIRVRANAANDPEYLAAFLNTAYAKRVLRNMCKSIVGMANINARELQGIRVAEPPLELQKVFAERVRRLEDAKSTHRVHLAQLDELFASVQQRAFRGELWNN